MGLVSWKMLTQNSKKSSRHAQTLMIRDSGEVSGPAEHFQIKWGQAHLKSDNLQYNTLGRWDKRLIDQASDVPSIIFFHIFIFLKL